MSSVVVHEFLSYLQEQDAGFPDDGRARALSAVNWFLESPRSRRADIFEDALAAAGAHPSDIFDNSFAGYVALETCCKLISVGADDDEVLRVFSYLRNSMRRCYVNDASLSGDLIVVSIRSLRFGLARKLLHGCCDRRKYPTERAFGPAPMIAREKLDWMHGFWFAHLERVPPLALSQLPLCWREVLGVDGAFGAQLEFFVNELAAVLPAKAMTSEALFLPAYDNGSEAIAKNVQPTVDKYFPLFLAAVGSSRPHQRFVAAEFADFITEQLLLLPLLPSENAC